MEAYETDLHVGSLIIRLWFWGKLCHNCNKKPLKYYWYFCATPISAAQDLGFRGEGWRGLQGSGLTSLLACRFFFIHQRKLRSLYDALCHHAILNVLI